MQCTYSKRLGNVARDMSNDIWGGKQEHLEMKKGTVLCLVMSLFLLPFYMTPVFQPRAKVKVVSSSHKNHFKTTNKSSSFHPQLQQTGITAPNRNEIAD